jgi:hypothetical protein
MVVVYELLPPTHIMASAVRSGHSLSEQAMMHLAAHVCAIRRMELRATTARTGCNACMRRLVGWTLELQQDGRAALWRVRCRRELQLRGVDG